MKRLDVYGRWEEGGDLPRVLAFVRESSANLVTQKEMCRYLGITEQTFCALKKRHPEFAKAMDDAKLDLKEKLFDALLRKALGYEAVEEEQFIEDGGRGEKQKRKIHRTKRHVPPDYRAIVYILTKKFGKEFGERYEELLLAERKMEQSKETWDDGEARQAEADDEEA